MIKRLADALLRRVYYPVTAVVCMDEWERVVSVELFDSFFASPDCALAPQAKTVLLICSHPDGSMELAQEERRSCRQIALRAKDCCVRVYIFGEDIGLFEVDIAQILGYNGENAV